jgi:glycosyltransferase involved in cell wall biosynthesis
VGGESSGLSAHRPFEGAVFGRRYARPPVSRERSLRILGVSVPDVSDWHEERPAGRWSQFYAALAARTSLVDTIRPQRSRTAELANLAVNFRPSRAAWRARAGFNLGYAAQLSASIERQLAPLAGRYDLIVQLQTLCEPGTDHNRAYVIYTDNTFALTQRMYPEWEPLAANLVARWLAFEAEVCTRARAVYTFSEWARASVIDDYGCSPDHVVAIGAGANHLEPELGDKRWSPPTALFVGSPLRRKGGLTLLKAWPEVLSQVPDARLLIVGPDGRPPGGLPASVTWVGNVDRYRLDVLYRNASVFVLPSLFEPWGHVFVEAMGHGLPCIATTLCAMPEIIEQGTTGLLVRPGEPEPLARALVELLGDPARAERMGRAGHARVLDSMMWHHVADRLLTDVDEGSRLAQR